jgi:hypothetical protein
VEETQVKKTKLLLLATAVVALSGGSAWAKSSASEVARLGKDLTPMGSERAGTPDGMVRRGWRAGAASGEV